MIQQIPAEYDGHTHFFFSEAAKILDVNVITIRSWRKKGFFRVEWYRPSMPMIPREEIENILAGKNTFGKEKKNG